MPTSRNVLLVGAGAVGQAYGFHLDRGGAAITYFVREKYVEALRGGVSVRCHNGRHAGHHHFDTYALITTLEELASSQWDEVWLCVSSPALRQGWLSDLLGRIGGATLVMLQPGLRDYELICEHIPADQVVRGMITLVSYQAPLAGAREAAPRSR